MQRAHQQILLPGRIFAAMGNFVLIFILAWNGWVRARYGCFHVKPWVGTNFAQQKWLQTVDMSWASHLIVCMHLVATNLQSIRSTERFMDDFDLTFPSATWRHEMEETVLTPGGNKLILAGGIGHGGVGLCISRAFSCQVQELTFHVFSFRLCSLTLMIKVTNLWFLHRLFFFPTPFCRDKLSESCSTGQVPGIGTIFITCYFPTTGCLIK